MERKLTPTGQLLLSVDAPREAWLAARKDGITATDLPAILGLNKYKTAIDVWLEKLNPADELFEPALGEKEAAFWGIQLEDTVARAWAESAGVTVRRVGILANEDLPWMRASLDRLVQGCPDGRCGLEVKTRSGYVADEWSQGVPADVAAQVHWQLLVSGLDHIHVIALLGGQRLVQHKVSLEGVDSAAMIANALLVWDAVRSGEAPKLPENLWTDQYLEQAHPDRGGEVEVDASVAETVQAYLLVLDQERELGARKAELRTQLVGALGDFESATWNGQPIYSYKTSTSRRFDQKALAALYPETSDDDRLWSVSETRSLRITQKKEGKS